MQKDKIYFGENGLTSTSANHIANLAKEYYQTLLRRQEILSKELSPKVSIHNTLITTFGLTYNEYSGIFTNVITLEDIFAG